MPRLNKLRQDTKKENLKIDAKDKRIMHLLSEDSRIPINKIAKHIGIGRDTVQYRISRLVDLGIIEKFVPEIDYTKLGFNTGHLFLLIKENDEEKHNKFIEELKHAPNTVSVIEYSDSWDIELTFIIKNAFEFDRIITSILTKYSDMIIERASVIVMDTYYSVLLPYLCDCEHKSRNGSDVLHSHKIDKHDQGILLELCRDARQSSYKIAENVKLSPDAILLRMKKLMEKGIIRKHTFIPNFKNLGFSTYTFAIRMRHFDREKENKLRTFIEQHPYIIKGVKTLGRWDILIYIISKQPDEFHKTVKDIKRAFPDSIYGYDTFVVNKEHHFVPVPKILSE